jgi:hypothetical protein
MRLLLFVAAITAASLGYAQDKIYVSVAGNDRGPGTIDRPLKTISTALNRAADKTGDLTIYIMAGQYSLDSTINISSETYRLHSLMIEAYHGGKVEITGSIRIKPVWQPYKNGILKAHVDLKDAPDQLFFNGKSLSMARYPNYDSNAGVYHGTAADAFSSQRARAGKILRAAICMRCMPGNGGTFIISSPGKMPATAWNMKGDGKITGLQKCIPAIGL